METRFHEVDRVHHRHLTDVQAVRLRDLNAKKMKRKEEQSEKEQKIITEFAEYLLFCCVLITVTVCLRAIVL